MTAKLKNYLHLHFIILVWGFTAILGKLIQIDALPLVWYRMVLASSFIAVFIFIRKIGFKVAKSSIKPLLLAGIALGLHWVTFFAAIKVSNISIALTTMATGAFFGSLIEPIWYKRKVIAYEVIFGLLTSIGIYIIFKSEGSNTTGLILGLTSSFLSVLFTMANGKLSTKEKPSKIGFYEMIIGSLMLTFYLGFTQQFKAEFFTLTLNDWIFLSLLASICTAYAFIASVKVMQLISPYTVLLSVNLEPVYGIILAVLIFGESEKMQPMFYVGASVILLMVILNGVFKNKIKTIET